VGIGDSLTRRKVPSPTSSVPAAVQPHQGRFAPLRGAQAGILDPSGRRRADGIVGTGRGTGLLGPNKEHGLGRESRILISVFTGMRLSL
jgi:hypothetical protein